MGRKAIAMGSPLLRLASGLAVMCCAGLPPRASHAASPSMHNLAVSRRPAPATSVPALKVLWVRVAPGQAQVLYAGGGFACPFSQLPATQPPCSSWMMRSTDGGNTWADLRPNLGIPVRPTDKGFGDEYALSSTLIAPNEQHLYATLIKGFPGASGSV